MEQGMSSAMANAEALARAVQDYWRGQGYEVKAHVARVTCAATKTMIGVVVSDLVNGLPPGFPRTPAAMRSLAPKPERSARAA